jgi:hypothetical protein
MRKLVLVYFRIAPFIVVPNYTNERVMSRNPQMLQLILKAKFAHFENNQNTIVDSVVLNLIDVKVTPRHTQQKAAPQNVVKLSNGARSKQSKHSIDAVIMYGKQ